MSHKTVIQVEGIGKRYRLGHTEEKAGSFGKAVLKSASAPFRYLRYRMSEQSERDTLWALKDVSFEVKEGEVVGIIGANGAGKSTLLKIFSRITEPTEGRITIAGRVNSLLEVGVGFHPELTGRENVYLNASLHGLSKAEIDRRFDAIVDFSGVEKFLDTPVKRYSSGMNVRLGFAVAAHLDPDILIVDEVLAVGDFSFQQKCIGKLAEESESGRTVLFVSHNMAAVQRLCSRCIMLKNGKVVASGDVNSVTQAYLSLGNDENLVWKKNTIDQDKAVAFLKMEAVDENGKALGTRPVTTKDALSLSVTFIILQRVPALRLGVVLMDSYGNPICSTAPEDSGHTLNTKPGTYCLNVSFPENILMPQRYAVRLALYIPGHEQFDVIEDVLFSAHATASSSMALPESRRGILVLPCKWTSPEKV